MNIRILSPALHGVLDYAAAAGLIVLPLILDIAAVSPLAAALSIAGGVALIAYSLLTDYRFGVFRLLPFHVHLALDLAAAAAFAIAPFVFGWSGLVLGYYLFMAAGVVVVVLLSRANEGNAGDVRLESGHVAHEPDR